MVVGGRGIEPLLSRCKRESLPLQQPPVNYLFRPVHLLEVLV